MTESLTVIEKGGGFIEFFMPEPQVAWSKFQKIKQKDLQVPTEKLVDILLKQAALKTGTVGALTSVGGLFTLPFLLPVDIIASSRLDAELVFMIAFAHGVKPYDPDLKMMVYWILAGETVKTVGKTTAKIAAEHLATSAASDMAISGGKQIVQETVIGAGKSLYSKISKSFKILAKKTGKGAVQKVSRNAAKKAGTKVLTKAIPRVAAKIFPVLGMIVGFIVNFATTRGIGHLANQWFLELPTLHAELDLAFTSDSLPESELETQPISGNAYD